MTIAATIVWEVRTGGSDNNGGGYKTGATGTDFSQQNAAQFALTTVTTAAANAICLDVSAATTMVGNICNIISGTNFTPGLYEIISVVAGVSFTLDRTCTTAAGSLGTMNIGGSFASPGKAAISATVSGNKIWVKAATYTITTATLGAAGPVAFITGISTVMEGYTTTRGDRAGRPVLSAGAVTTATLYATVGTSSQAFIHLEADGNSKTGISGFSTNLDGSLIEDCIARNCDQASQNGFTITGSGGLRRCKAISCTVGFSLAPGHAFLCWADGCATGFSLSSNAANALLCIATDSTGDGFVTSARAFFSLCTAEGNGGDGFDVGANRVTVFACTATNNTAFGFNTGSGTLNILDFCASYNNTSGRTNTAPFTDTNSVTLSGDPWTNAATDDYRPNNTAGAGASLRAIAAVGIMSQTDNRDLSAVQHADPAAGGSGGNPFLKAVI